MLVLFLFFGNVKASLIVGCSMPLSILIAITLLNAAGFSFDLMTGTSLIIAIGMIVDNSIVVLESCFRAHEKGLDFKEAAAQGTSEVMLSIFAGTLTTVVFYIPLALASGMSGQMAAPLSWTITLTMLSSFLCAITVVPLVFSLVKPVPKTDLPINRILSKAQSFYRRVTPSLLRHPGRVVTVAVVILLGAVLLATQLEFVLFPSNYNGSVKIEAAFRSGTKLEVMKEGVSDPETALLSDQDFKDVTLDISGNTASFTAYSADGSKRTSEDAVEEYTRRFGSSAGMDVTVTPTGSGDSSALMDTGNTVDITLVGDDLPSLEQGADMVEESMSQVPGVLKIDNKFDQSRVQGKLIIDAQKAMAAGMTQSAVALQVNYLLNGMTATTIGYGDREYDVVLESPEGRYDDFTAFMDHPLATGSGAQVTLGDIATVEYSTTLPSIFRQDNQFITTISAITTEDAKYSASDTIKANVKNLNFPGTVTQGMSTSDKMSQDETSNMTGILLIAIFLVFLVMAIQFDSPRLSLMIMLCIPFSLIGSFGALFLSGNPMSIMGIMGFLMLFGIVVNNGILLVDTINQLRQTIPLEQALVQAGIIRLRPILMTTLTTILSMAPMIFSTDSGVSMMKEMSFIIIGGLAASTILTLFLMPSFYLMIRRENVAGAKKKGLFHRKSAKSWHAAIHQKFNGIK